MTLDRFHSSDVHINEDLDFSSLVSNPALLKGLTNSGYQRPSPIQLKTIPLGRLGLDLIAQAKSGTGKTVVFGVIAIESVLSAVAAQQNTSHSGSKEQPPRAVIIAPTREIAVQIQDVVQKLASAGLAETITCHAMIGGMPVQQDRKNLKQCSIVVGTPGRVRSLIDSGYLKPDLVRLLVLDEADKLMEDVFKEDIFEIAKGLGSNKQVMAFSATYDEDLLSHLDRLVKSPVYVMLSNGTPELEAVLQYSKLTKLDERHKASSIFMKQTLMMQAKFAELETLLTHVPFYQAIVFLNRRTQAADLVKFLTRKGWPALHIASGLSQEERLAVMDKARKFELRVLVCSDLIARGIDIDRVNLVINLDLPRDPETYLHRVGRTGRYGTTGLAVSIVDDAEQTTVETLKRDFGITIKEISTDDSTYSDITSHSQNRHHERPLQMSADQEQFKKLEAERKAGEQRVLQDDEVFPGDQETVSEQDGGEHPVTARKRRVAEIGHSEGNRNRSDTPTRKRRKKGFSLLTPEQTPSIEDSEVESMHVGENRLYGGQSQGDDAQMPDAQDTEHDEQQYDAAATHPAEDPNPLLYHGTDLYQSIHRRISHSTHTIPPSLCHLLLSSLRSNLEALDFNIRLSHLNLGPCSSRQICHSFRTDRLLFKTHLGVSYGML
ncbi:DEAD (Asp-Glu-Ala-Asp) box polypeptide 20 [Mortierella alpina]|uniref:RNA helicase n=1 Tax=Mortierella alpina TaxID=64518 RepID=A0A9P6JCZ1_MORAP|nr:DEAD (Asp-Glu-Ala-Asp) box polypeptide 20 [Mortierella alpina]